MSVPTDGRERRGVVRRLAFAAVAAAVGPLPAAPDWMAPAERDLYESRRRDIVDWLRARGRGELVAPPGGVGTLGGGR